MRLSTVAAGLVFVLGVPSLAFGYCRTTTCAQQDPPAECVPGEIVRACQMAGLPLYWEQPCVSFSVQQDGSKAAGMSAAVLEKVVRTSFDNWQNVTCSDGSKPNMSVETYPRVECHESRYNQNAPNQNVWMFRDDSWPHEGSGDRTIALTLVSFSPKTGQIFDVDVELNSFARNFTREVPTPVGMDDLDSVVQHESGHFLGLAHSDVSEATMWANYNGSVDMRSLHEDDIQGMCAVYPPTTKAAATCDATPRHGFSTQCEEKDDGCTLSRPGSNAGHRVGLALFLAACAFALGRVRQYRR